MRKLAFYDFQVSPYSYDFVSFLMAAKSAGCDQVVFVPGRRMTLGPDGKEMEFQKCSPAEQEFRMQNLLLPLCANPIVCKTRNEARKLWHEECFPHGYTVEKPTIAHLLGHVMRSQKLFPLKASAPELERARRFIDDKTVLITIRESTIKTSRNSQIDEWMKAAQWMSERGLKPIFIPDTDNLHRDFAPFMSLPEAAVNVQHRLACYEAAMLNCGINTGPMALCFYSHRPLLYFRPLGSTYETSGDFWIKNLLAPGMQPPWFHALQRIIWDKTDDAETIIHGVKKWLDVRAGTDKWEPMLAPTFPVYGVLTNGERDRQMDAAVALGFPMLPKLSGFGDETLSIVCYGPSLRDTWREIKRPIMTVSGAHDFLIERGIVPDYHTDCDPREHKARMLTRPHPDVRYMMASCCHAKFWEILKGMNVTLWHLMNGEDTMRWADRTGYKGELISGGTTAGSRAFEVAARLRYRKFEVHGFDCSYDPKGTHAGAHLGKPQARMRVRCGDEWFESSPQMIEAAREMQKFLASYDVECTLHGRGLLQRMVVEGVKLSAEAKAEAEKEAA